MPNKHQIQQDFYTKMSEWKENYKVNTGTQNEENKDERIKADKRRQAKALRGIQYDLYR